MAADPDLIVARAAWGELLLKIGRDEQAIAVFKGAVARNPSYALAWYELGFALRERKKFPEAAEAYRAYIALRPDDPDPHYGLGMALRRMGYTAAALASFQTYVTMETRPGEQRWVERAKAQIESLRAGAAPKAAQ